MNSTDFIQIRIDKIEEIRRTFEGNLYLNKKLESKYRNLDVEIKLKDYRTNNIHFVVDEKSEKLVNRIKNIQQIVNSFLNGHLMKEVSKSPMIKPPVVKNNVLKMKNNNKNHAITETENNIIIEYVMDVWGTEYPKKIILSK